MNQLADLHHKRWGGKSRAFRSEGYITFHNALAKKLLKKKRLRLHFIEQSEKPIAAFYGFRYNHCYYYYQSGRDLAFSRYHLGYVLMNHCIQEAINEGAAIFDFLTGTEEYKYRWANDCKRNYQICAYRDRNARYVYRLLNILEGTLNSTGIK
jgi:CelD/BcsL family acetyltransferase involved in cellulose biosynthesis